MPKNFREDEDHYDANPVFKATLKKFIEPTAWSRAKGIAGMDVRDISVAHLCRRGLDEYGLRPLSHGKFTGVILTRNIAETVLLAHLQKKLREGNIDVDATVDAMYKARGITPPDKVKEATTYIGPIVDEFLSSIKPWTQVKNYATANYDTNNETAQRMQTLEEEAAKYKQRLRNAGIDVTPTKALPLQDGSQQSDPPHSAPSGHQEPPPPVQQPAKRRRLQRGDANNKHKLEQLIHEPFNVIKQADQAPPTSMTAIKTWIINIKKTVPADKHAEMDNHMQNVQKILEEGRFNKSQLQEMATRWGLPISLITSTSAHPKSLQQLIAAVTFLAV